MVDQPSAGTHTSWIVAYTKPRAEAWAEMNLRRQHFHTLLPRVAKRSGFPPLFPRYLFVGFHSLDIPAAIRSTYGVQYIVSCGAVAARVPDDVIAEILSRMDERGLVQLERVTRPNALFAQRERDRVRALVRLAAAGFRVKSA